jgi:hypothetical protein
MSATDITALSARIEELYEKATSDLDDDAAQTVEQVMTMLDEGEIRVAAPTDTGLAGQRVGQEGDPALVPHPRDGDDRGRARTSTTTRCR